MYYDQKKIAKLMVYVCVCVFTACAQTKYVVPNDTVTQTTTKTKTIQRDSVYRYEKDSMAISMRSGAHVGSGVDTMVIEKWHEHWKDRWLTRIDTLLQHDTTTITQTQTITQTVTERYVPKFYKWCTLLLWLLVVGKIIKIIIKVLK